MIKKIKIKQFAGVNDLEIEVRDGLNVILGPNEAGKSTIVDALYALMFVDSKLNFKKTGSKQFIERALPYNKSDYAEGSLDFSFEGDNYTLNKLWHHQKNELDMTRNGIKILNKSEIEDILKRYLVYGEGTYSNAIFSKQDAFKRVFESLKEDQESVHNVEELLKKASMALDGLSIEAYRSRLLDIQKELTGNWDLERNRPIGNRMSDDPHRRNVGKILSHFYNIDSANKELEKAYSLEKNLEKYKNEIALSEESIENISNNSDLDGETEAEFIQGDRIKKELLLLENEYKSLIEINREWPVLSNKIGEHEKNIALHHEKLMSYNTKLENAKKYKELEKDLVLLEKRKSIESEISGLETENKKYEKINDEDIQQAIELEKKISTSLIKLKSAELAGKVNHSNNPVNIIDVYGNKQEIEKGDSWTSNGYMKIEILDALELEIKSNQISVDEVKSTLEQSTKELNAILKQLEITSIIDAQAALQNKRGNAIKINSLKKQLDDLPDDERKSALEEEKNRLEGLNLEKIEVIENHIRDQQKEKNEMSIDKAKLENKVENWEKAYNSYDGLIKRLGEVIVKKEKKTTELSTLKALPDGYASLEDYLSKTREMRKQKDAHLQKIQQLKFEIERMMDQFPERSIEELERIIEGETRHFQNSIKKANQVKTIMETFEETIKLLENNSISPLQRKFAENLKYITDNRYDEINFSDQMDVTIGRGQDIIPTSLLSSGTLDSVSLAFRLAFVSELMEDKQGLTVLDDCLVNMDEERQSRSIKMIQDHSHKHQVIFVTCHPDVADELGGNLIKL